MLKEHATIFRRLTIAADLCLVTGAFFLAYCLRVQENISLPMNQRITFVLIFDVLWGVSLYFSGMYTSFRLKRISTLLIIIGQAAFINFFIFAGISYLFKIICISRLFILLSFIYAALFLIIEKFILIRFFRNLRKKGFNYRNMLIAGTGKQAQHFIQWIDNNKEFGLKIIGLVDTDATKVGEFLYGHKVIGTFEDIPSIHRQNQLDSVLFVVPHECFSNIEAAIEYLETVGVKIDIALDCFSRRLARARQTEFCGASLLTLESTPIDVFSLILKRFLDVVLSGLAIVVCLPFFLLISVLIKATSKGPVLFTQERCGANGRKFKLYKFRTMIVDAEARLKELQGHNEMQGPVFKIKHDPRITFIGRILRKLSIDECPQFWNVFKGDMSLVGPRPPLPDEVSGYDNWHLRRLSMRPGITCIWQVSGRNNITDFGEWTQLDLEYIDNWSLWLDIKILFKTIPVVLFGIGAK